MKKLRVGVWVHELIPPEEGGGFGYYYQLIKKINTCNFSHAEIIFLSQNEEIVNYNFKNKYRINWTPYRENITTRLVNKLSKIFRVTGRIAVIEKRKKEHDQSLKDELNKQVDVIYYPSPMCVFPNFPYICTLWDLGHLSMFAFPEVSMNTVFEGRKIYHDKYLYKALMIFAESEAGKSDIVKYLNINEDRIKVVPLFPSELVTSSISVQMPKGFDESLYFIHYPAQFWAHKNHFNLLIALKEVIKKLPKIKLVLTGSDKGNKEYVKQVIMELGLVDSVIDLGFVSTEEMKWLYLHSQGLVMPTFLGPTNMPLVEAAELGCPVACSKLAGHIEQIGDYGYYFDPKNPQDISDVICEMLLDKGRNVKKPYTSNFNIDNAILAIDKSFSELRNIRFCWGAKDEIY